MPDRSALRRVEQGGLGRERVVEANQVEGAALDPGQEALVQGVGQVGGHGLAVAELSEQSELVATCLASGLPAEAEAAEPGESTGWRR